MDVQTERVSETLKPQEERTCCRFAVEPRELNLAPGERLAIWMEAPVSRKRERESMSKKCPPREACLSR